MTMLKSIERELLRADARLEPAPAASAASSGGSLRGRWRRLGRGGRLAGVLAGGLVLGAVATGSAQVAGLDPWGKLVGENAIDPALRPLGGTSHAVGVLADDAPGRPGWALKAYVARNGKVCVVAAGRGGEGLFDCRTSDAVAAVLAGKPMLGAPLAGVTQTGPPTMSPKHVVAWALTDWSQPAARFEVPGGTTVRTKASDEPLHVTVDHSSAGLSRRGLAILATLPEQLTLRLTVAEVSSRAPITTHGDVVVLPPRRAALGQPTIVQVTTETAWVRSHRRRFPETIFNGDLDRGQPVSGATARQLLTFPALARPRVARDAIPAAAITKLLRAGRIQPSASRRLVVTGTGNLGPAWLAPGALPDSFTVPSIDGQVCIAGPVVISGCTATDAVGTLPDPESVVCGTGLPKDHFLVWAFVPAGADRVRVDRARAPSVTYPAGDLLTLLQRRADPLPTQLVWSGPNGFRATSRVAFPKQTATAICGSGRAPHFTDLRGSVSGGGEGHS